MQHLTIYIDGNRNIGGAILRSPIKLQLTGNFLAAWLFSQKSMNEPKTLRIFILHQKVPTKWLFTAIVEKEMKACEQIWNEKQTIKNTNYQLHEQTSFVPTFPLARPLVW